MSAICRTCGCTPCNSPAFCRSCREADRKRKQQNENRTPAKSRRACTPQSTVDAILYSVKARGVAALKESANVDRLARCDDAARATVNAHISKLVGAL